jgi:hypothetical protein
VYDKSNGPYGRALQYASEDLKADKEVVLEAVKQDVSALEYASEDLRRGPDLIAASRQPRQTDQWLSSY